MLPVCYHTRQKQRAKQATTRFFRVTNELSTICYQFVTTADVVFAAAAADDDDDGTRQKTLCVFPKITRRTGSKCLKNRKYFF